MSKATQDPTITIQIEDKEYRVACPPKEQTALKESAHYLDNTLRKMRAAGKTTRLDRTAIMTMLNISHELLNKPTADRQNADHQNKATQQKVVALNKKVDQALKKFG